MHHTQNVHRFFVGMVTTLVMLTSAGEAWSFAERYTFTVLASDQSPNSDFFDLRGPIAIDPDDGTVVMEQTYNVDYAWALQLAPTFQVLSGLRPSGALDVDNGVIVGFVYDTELGSSGHYPSRAAAWDHGTLRLLPRPQIPGDHVHTVATCVNADGDIWGAAIINHNRTQQYPLQWGGGDIPVQLPTLGGQWGSVTACDDKGNSAGWSLTAQNVMQCTWWSKHGRASTCHPHAAATDSTAVAMNNRNQVAGNATVRGLSYGYLWHGAGVWWLMSLPGDTSSAVAAINAQGDVVGDSCGRHGCRAVGWEDGRPVEILSRTLDSGGWLFTNAVAIDDLGRIVVQGSRPGDHPSYERTLVLSPVPQHVSRR